MNRKITFLLVTGLLALSACSPTPQFTLVPVDTLVAQTMAALPRTDTPIPREGDQGASTPEPGSAEGGAQQGTATPEVNAAIPGAQCIPADTERTRGLVTRVISGDTIEVAIGSEVRQVKYLGLDAPEASSVIEWYGPQATGYNRDLVAGRTVTLVKDVSDTDAQGRLLRYVLTEDAFLNYEMVRQGYSAALVTPPDLACQQILLSVEADARQAQLGLWSPTPLPTATETPTPTNTPDATATNTPPPPCDCEGPKLTCNNFNTQASAQACFSYCKAEGFGDIFGMDKNENNKACEGLP